MGVTYRDGISILQLLIYVPSFLVAVFLVARHGLRRNSGFLFLVLFTLTRIVGACCELATISHPSTGLFTAAAICSSIGLSPLLLACSGLLSRANESVKNTTGRRTLDTRFFHVFRLLTVVCMVLSIVGLTQNMTLEGLKHPDALIKAGMILYLVSWVQLCLYLAILAACRRSLEKGESRTLLAVAISSPFIFVRILYAMLVWFLATGTFNLLNGNVTVLLVMSVLEEFVVVIVCLVIGLTLRVRGKVPSRQETALPVFTPPPYKSQS